MFTCRLVALIGKAGCGKDTILKRILEIAPKKFHKVVGYTTRPPRENEKEGIDYFFISEEEFKHKIQSNSLLEYTHFNNWFYGIDKNTLSTGKINICILSPSSCIDILKHNKEMQLIPFYIIASDKTRLIRQLERENNPNVKEIIRRYFADEKDFQYAVYYNSLLNEYKKDIDECAMSIIKNNARTIYYEDFLEDCKKILETRSSNKLDNFK